MSTQKTLFIAVFVVSLNLVWALRCNVCLGSMSSDCYYAKSSSFVVKNCTFGSPQLFKSDLVFNNTFNNKQENKLECIQMISKTPSYESSAFMRSCIEFPAFLDTCFVLQSSEEVDHCRACKDDNCNNIPGTKRF